MILHWDFFSATASHGPGQDEGDQESLLGAPKVRMVGDLGPRHVRPVCMKGSTALDR